jgi:hypothetical protein
MAKNILEKDLGKWRWHFVIMSCNLRAVFSVYYLETGWQRHGGRE